ncbi:hypothetical protein Pcaca05_40060 [Pectobacterium carotovorum subsp. carotovorum]|nr:hypothetical protein Pcaca05_40060 [Pectobacterium carotovorum subsp. carotovorum]
MTGFPYWLAVLKTRELDRLLGLNVKWIKPIRRLLQIGFIIRKMPYFLPKKITILRLNKF